MPPALVLGPLLRHVGETDATVWVETDAACEVRVATTDGAHEASSPTFHVRGHHYALVVLADLPRAGEHPYEVRLDGELAWPDPGSDWPASTIRTLDPDEPLEVCFGSCRLSLPHEPPYTLSADEDERGRERDALHALALRLRDERDRRHPHALLLLGDQVYADEVSLGARDFIHSRRDTAKPPGEEVADFEEYTHLYLDAWRDPSLRWLLSTVASAMIFDDHDIHDDWNTSEAWLRQMRAQPWWEERIVGGLVSYWIYQHIGNLSPAELADDELYARVRAADDGWPLLHEFARQADETTDGSRWSYARDLGRTRLVMVDSRAGRVLEPGGRRMVDQVEWEWIEDHARGDCDHLLIGTSIPLLLAPGMHHLEAWNEAVCDGAWGGLAARLGERIRQGLDLEHWGAFRDSFRRMTQLLREVAAGRRGDAPASIVVLSGDVHHAYLAEVGFPQGTNARSAVYQAVCSPVRNPLGANERRGIRVAASNAAGVAARGLARAAGVADPEVGWRFTHDEPWFDNQIATLVIEGRRASMRLERAGPSDSGDEPPGLERVFERALA